MKKLFSKLNLSLLGINLILSFISHGQCSGGVDGGALSAFTAAYQTTTVTRGTYYTFYATAGCITYDFSFCNGGGADGTGFGDPSITIRDAADAVTMVFDNSSCGVSDGEVLGWTPPADGFYRIVISGGIGCTMNANKTATLAFRENSAPLSTTGDYTLQGDATTAVDPLCVELTANTSGQTGCAWDVNSTLNFGADFTFDFTVNLGSNDGGADGVAFVIQNDPAGICACGSDGSGFAAAGVTNSLIVEVDTYLNTEDRNDGASMVAEGVDCFGGGTEPDHLDIWLNGAINPNVGGCPYIDGVDPGRVIPTAVPLLDGGVLYNVENGNDHILRVAWNAGSGTFSATLMNLALSTTYGVVSIVIDPLTVFGTTTPFFGFTAATGGFSNQQTFCNPATLLPVNVVDFNVDCNKNNTVLKWEVVSERNNDYFTLLRSVDGLNFDKIGRVSGRGTSNATLMYEFIDENKPNQQCYYTFSQTDFDGTEKLCGFVRVVECVTEVELKLFPNPSISNQPVHIELDKNMAIQVIIMEATGKLLYETKLALESEKIIYPNLKSGLYHVIIRDVNGTQINAVKLIVLD